jgi:hypothetical protein
MNASSAQDEMAMRNFMVSFPVEDRGHFARI